MKTITYSVVLAIVCALVCGAAITPVAAADLQTRTHVAAHIDALRKSTWKVVTDSDPDLDLVPRADYAVIRARGTYLLAQLKKQVDALHTAVGAVAVDAVGQKVDSIGVLSTRFASAAAMDRQALTDMASAAAKGDAILTAALTARTTGTLAYRSKQAAWAGAGTWAAKDRTAALLAIRRGAIPPSRAYPEQARRATAGLAVTPAAGLTGIPGGCALPSASADTWLGAASSPGLHAWTSSDDVTAYLERVAAAPGGSELKLANDRALWTANQTIGDTPTDASDAVDTAGTVGFMALAGANAQARSAARDDLLRLAGDYLGNPLDLDNANQRLDGSFYMWAAASALNWAQPDGVQDSALSERLWVHWMGPYTCVLARGDSSMIGSNNIAVTLNSGVTMTALIQGSSRPGIAAAIVRRSASAALPGLRILAADGGTPEGPTYWNLQTVPVAGLYSTWHSVFGAAGPITLPDMRKTAIYAYQIGDRDTDITPTFSDAKNQYKRTPSALPAWVAGQSNPSAEAVALAKEAERSIGIQQLWWPAEDPGAPAARSTLFPRSGIAVLHGTTSTAWVTAGTDAGAHTQLQAGAVGYIRNGVQWGLDPGAGDYGQPGYFDQSADSPRWTYFHPGSKGHSTLSTTPTATNPGQVIAAPTPMQLADSTVSINLKPALAGTAAATRTVELGAGGELTITDTVANAPAMVWRWVTTAVPTAVDGNTVDLEQSGGHHLTMDFAGLPAGATVSIDNAGVIGDDGRPIKVVRVNLPARATLTLTVSLY